MSAKGKGKGIGARIKAGGTGESLIQAYPTAFYAGKAVFFRLRLRLRLCLQMVPREAQGYAVAAAGRTSMLAVPGISSSTAFSPASVPMTD